MTAADPDAEYMVSVDVRDLFAFLRAAWREGQHYDREGVPDQADSWSAATDHASKVIDRWVGASASATLRNGPFPLFFDSLPVARVGNGGAFFLRRRDDGSPWPYGTDLYVAADIGAYISGLVPLALSPDEIERLAQGAGADIRIDTAGNVDIGAGAV
ncbi:hypothetical protein AB4Y36_10210 [Paraburkholderia sp. BR10936]|uniref:hypothetical protein n=1 Tax=Paraburkholderia sp. BR10936 TaxID=3236993 RepID=UPI0034D2995E